MTDLKLVAEIKVGNTLGEGIVWDSRNQCVWWSDILENKLYRWTFSGSLEIFATPEALCSFGLTHTDNLFIAGFASGFAWFDPISQSIEWITKVESDIDNTRLNDGRVDRQGRFWAGSMDMRESEPSGSLYCLQNQYAVKRSQNITVSNGLCWSCDGTVIYHADSPTRTIRAASFSPESGEIGIWKNFIKTDKGAYPDGSCVDSNDNVWNAQWGSSSVKAYSSKGKEIICLEVPAKQPSCVAFGGKDLNHLFVTSAKVGLDDSTSKLAKNNGNVFVYETPFKGLDESICSHMADSHNLIKEVS